MKSPSTEAGKRLLNADLAKLLSSPICTTERIEALLAAAQSRGAKVNKTAKDKESLVHENLRRAVAEGHVPIPDVYELLRDSEEHDAQYHYFYAPAGADEEKAIADFPSVGRAMIGDGWATLRDTPNFLAKPHGEKWGDFRVDLRPDGQPAGWTAKLYWGDSRWVLDLEQSKQTATKRVKVWVPQYAREVWLVRWRADRGLLELCLPKLGSRNDQFEALAALWKHVGKFVTESDVNEFTFDEAATAFLHDKESFKDEIHLGGPARLMSDDGGSTIMCPRSSQQGLLDSPDRASAAKHYESCHELCIYWRPTKATDAIKETVKTFTGHWDARHSVMFTAKNSGKTVRHVTQRLIDIEIQQRDRKARRAADSRVD